MDHELILSDIRVALGRVEERVDRILEELEEISEIQERVLRVERQVAHAKAWSAGAWAAIMGVAALATWILTSIPANVMAR